MSTYFVSGHRDISNKEFHLHYKKSILNSVLADPMTSFVVGDCDGVDALAQEYIASLQKKYKDISITVYHTFTRPFHNPCNLPLKGGYTSDHDRDSAMTNASDKDIAWVRSGKKNSGTAQNLLRRQIKNMALEMVFEDATEFLNGMIAVLSHHQGNVDGEAEIWFPSTFKQ